MTTAPFFQPSTISIVHASEHDPVRANLGLPPRLHGRRSVRDEHGPIVWATAAIEEEEHLDRSFWRAGRGDLVAARYAPGHRA